MQENKKRIEYLDIVRGICIIYMILGHVGLQLSWFDHYIHAFHMPIFFFISGFLFNKSETSILNYIIKMIKKLIIPYFIWSFIFTAINNKTLLGNFEGTKSNLYYIFTFNNVSLPIAGALWFLTSFFFCIIIFHILRKCIKNELILYFISFLIMLFGICLSKYFLFFWQHLNRL